MQTICIAVVGLRFGAAFPPIYRDHPDIERVAICDQNEAVLNAYGEQASLEWHRENEQPIITTMRPFNSAKAWSSDWKSVLAEPTDRLDLLPESIRRFMELVTIPDPKNPHQSISQGGGHHGSHPHMVHEFVRSITENRKPWIDDITAANWTAAGICAHESAVKGGAAVEIPCFD